MRKLLTAAIAAFLPVAAHASDYLPRPYPGQTHVYPKPDGSYSVYQGGSRVGTIRPGSGDSYIYTPSSPNPFTRQGNPVIRDNSFYGHGSRGKR